MASRRLGGQHRRRAGEHSDHAGRDVDDQEHLEHGRGPQRWNVGWSWGVTVPAAPSTVTSCPGRSRRVASPVPTTAGNAVLAGEKGGVRGQGAAVGDDGGGAGEQGCPGRGGGLGEEDLAVDETGEVLGSGDQVDRAGGPAGAGRLADDRTVGHGCAAAGGLDGPGDGVSDEPGSDPSVSGAISRRCRSHSARRCVTVSAWEAVGPSARAVMRSSWREEEDVLGFGDPPGGLQTVAEPVHAAAQQRPAQGEVTGLFFADHRVALGDL